MLIRHLVPPRLIAFAAVLFFALVIAPPALARKAYHAESYYTVIRVQADGSLRIREEIRMRFEGGPFTFFHRGVPTRHTDGILDLSSPDSIEVRVRRRRVDVTWRFDPLHDAERTFVLEYTAQNALDRTSAGHQLRWYGFPEERPYRIEAATVDVILPPDWPEPTGLRTHPRRAGLRIVGTPGADGELATAAAERTVAASPPGGSGLLLRSGPLRLKEDDSVILRADFAAGLITAELPERQQRRAEWTRHRSTALALAAVILALTLGVVFWLRQRWQEEIGVRREEPIARGLPPAVPQPPDDLPPSLVAGLFSSSSGSGTVTGPLATLLHHARRGALSFEVGAKRFVLGSRALHLRRASAPADLTPWEQTVLEAAFRRSKQTGVVAWNRAVEGLSRASGQFGRQIRVELIRSGDLDPIALDARRKLMLLGAVLFGVVLLLIVPAALLARTFGPWGALPAAAAFVSALAALALSQTVSPLTPQGVRRRHAWSGFRRYLKEAEKRGIALDSARFHAWLPLATALGVAPGLVKSGKRWGLTPPSWFQSPTGDPGDMAAFVTIMAASTGHGGGVGGGGGAGGGGSSGAG